MSAPPLRGSRVGAGWIALLLGLGAAESVLGETRVALSAPVVGAVAVTWSGAPGTAIATGGKGHEGTLAWVPAAGGEVIELARGLDGLDSVLAIDADRDGVADTLLAGHPGGIWQIGSGGALSVLEGDGVDLRSVRPTGTTADGLMLTRAGRLERRRLGAAALELLSATPTPQRLRPTSWGLQLEAARAWMLEGDERGRVAVGPLDRGSGRLETVLVGRDGSVETVWSLLPSGFRMTSSRLMLLGSSPVLLVAGATKIGVFVDQTVLVFSLTSDPSRRGFGPLGRVETPCAFFREPRFDTRKVGTRSELVVSCPKGLSGNELWLGAWEVGVGGRPRGARQIDVDGDVESWHATTDLDGDGIGDLVVLRADGRLVMFRGRDRGRPWERGVWRELQLAAVAKKQGEEEVRVSASGSEVETTRSKRSAASARVWVVDGDGAPLRVVAGRTNDDGVGEVVVSPLR